MLYQAGDCLLALATAGNKQDACRQAEAVHQFFSQWEIRLTYAYDDLCAVGLYGQNRTLEQGLCLQLQKSLGTLAHAHAFAGAENQRTDVLPLN